MPQVVLWAGAGLKFAPAGKCPRNVGDALQEQTGYQGSSEAEPVGSV